MAGVSNTIEPARDSLAAAAEAAAKVNAILIAQGKLKLSQPVPQPPVHNFIKTPAKQVFDAEVEINDAPIICRDILTRNAKQDEIAKKSGAFISTKGRYMSPDQRQTAEISDRPLYLYIQSAREENVQKAVSEINDIISKHGGVVNQTRGNIATINVNVSGPPTSGPFIPNVQQPPPAIPPMLTNIVPADLAHEPLLLANQVHFITEKLYVGLEHAPPNFDVRGRILGSGGCYLQHIHSTCGAVVTLRGRGSGYLEPETAQESTEPMHIHLQHITVEGLENAIELGKDLIRTVQSDYTQFQQQLALLPPLSCPGGPFTGSPASQSLGHWTLQTMPSQQTLVMSSAPLDSSLPSVSYVMSQSTQLPPSSSLVLSQPIMTLIQSPLGAPINSTLASTTAVGYNSLSSHGSVELVHNAPVQSIVLAPASSALLHNVIGTSVGHKVSFLSGNNQLVSLPQQLNSISQHSSNGITISSLPPHIYTTALPPSVNVSQSVAISSVSGVGTQAPPNTSLSAGFAQQFCSYTQPLSSYAPPSCSYKSPMFSYASLVPSSIPSVNTSLTSVYPPLSSGYAPLSSGYAPPTSMFEHTTSHLALPPYNFPSTNATHGPRLTMTNMPVISETPMLTASGDLILVSNNAASAPSTMETSRQSISLFAVPQTPSSKDAHFTHMIQQGRTESSTIAIGGSLQKAIDGSMPSSSGDTLHTRLINVDNNQPALRLQHSQVNFPPTYEQTAYAQAGEGPVFKQIALPSEVYQPSTALYEVHRASSTPLYGDRSTPQFENKTSCGSQVAFTSGSRLSHHVSDQASSQAKTSYTKHGVQYKEESGDHPFYTLAHPQSGPCVEDDLRFPKFSTKQPRTSSQQLGPPSKRTPYWRQVPPPPR